MDTKDVWYEINGDLFVWNRDKAELISRSARLAYPVRDGIPVMLEGEARTLSDEELEALPPRTPLAG